MAFGSDPGPGSGAVSPCIYHSNGQTILVYVIPAEAGLFDTQRASAKNETGFQDVPNVGDRAFLTLDGGAATLAFVKGGTEVTIAQSGSGAGPVIALGTAAAARL